MGPLHQLFHALPETQHQSTAFKMTVPNVLVAGLGSAHGDDQAGWLAIDYLQQMLLQAPATQSRVVARKLSTPLDLLPVLDQHPHVLIIDAAQVLPTENPQASLRIEIPAPWTPERLASCLAHHPRPRLDTHGIGLSHVLQLAQLQLKSSVPQVTLFCIPASDFAPFAHPSPATIELARITATQILMELHMRCRPASNA
jgi:Ni,Fe-hydrogenase maturation factor